MDWWTRGLMDSWSEFFEFYCENAEKALQNWIGIWFS